MLLSTNDDDCDFSMVFAVAALPLPDLNADGMNMKLMCVCEWVFLYV